MPRLTTPIPEVTVFLSSPSDVADERQIVKRIIEEINADPSWQTRCVLKALAYEDSVPSQMGKSAQRVVDDFMRQSSQADLVVCIFCNRMGTPTVDEKTGKTYRSGMHYEFDSAYQAYQASGLRAPRILLFLGERDFPAKSTKADRVQYIRAHEFREQITNGTEYQGLYFEYRELGQFQDLVRSHLKQHLHDLLAGAPPAELWKHGDKDIPTGSNPISSNPFVWRSGITDAAAFFDREREQGLVRGLLQKRQNCQFVGPRRIGKTSLLRQIERVARQWDANAVVAYVDVTAPQCYTLSGWLGRAAKLLGWATPPADLAGFAEGVEDMLVRGRRPVLCLDEFEELMRRPGEFTREFFLTLRYCGQQGLSIVTASHCPLSELTDPSDAVVSPFYNIFSLIQLGQFADADASDFVALRHEGVPGFTKKERAQILEFARGWPLALQVASYHVLEAKKSGDSTTAALRAAEEEMHALLPTWSIATS